ncbi:ribonuclease HIII [candidate division KSB1 bacterium]|nr:ribonuclease HIII [candidate division KSB1 bacterium]
MESLGLPVNSSEPGNKQKRKQRLHTFTVLHREKRDLIRYFIKGKYDPDEKEEQYCEYRFDLKLNNDPIIIKQYNSGKLVLSGPSGKPYKEIYHLICEQLDEAPSDDNPGDDHSRADDSLLSISFPYIGTDESGKGDYFGPLVCAGVWVDEMLAQRLKAIGVRDSKKLSDEKSKALAVEIKAYCRGKYAIVEIPPDKYNTLLSQMKTEGKSLNVLLAWGHARALENILATNPCATAVADQFGDERFIISKLQEKGKDLNLIQEHHAERNIGVAAASILARNRFLNKLKKLSDQYGINLPKGTSKSVIEVARQFVEKVGEEKLGDVAKLHFKTTESVLKPRK